MTSAEFVWARADDPQCDLWKAEGYALVGESWGAHLTIESAQLSRYSDKLKRATDLGYVVRTMNAAEMELVIKLEERNLGDYPYTPATSHEVPSPSYLDEIVSAKGFVFGAFEGKELVGVLATQRHPGKVEFEFASIRSEYRGKGLAGALGACAILKYATEGFSTFATGGAAVNSSSKGTVESLGFIIDEIWRSYKIPNA